MKSNNKNLLYFYMSYISKYNMIPDYIFLYNNKNAVKSRNSHYINPIQSFIFFHFYRKYVRK